MWDRIKLLVQNDAMKYLIDFECLKSMKIVPIVTGFVCPDHSFVMFKADKKLISHCGTDVGSYHYIPLEKLDVCG